MNKKLIVLIIACALAVVLLIGTTQAYSYDVTLKQLRNDSERDLNPVWSPDGKSIIFNKEYSLYELDLDTLKDEKLATGYRDSFAPKVSPDGSFVLFETGNKLYSLCLNDSSVTDLFPQDLGYSSLISPDGKEIAYFNGGHVVSSLAIGVSDGKDREVILSRTMLKPFAASWLPDGKNIIFSSGPPEKRLIQVVTTDGSASINGSDMIVIAEGNIVHQTQSWQAQALSPDGSTIVFSHKEDDNTNDIYEASLETLEIKRLTNNSVDDSFASYSPDGNHIVFVSKASGNEDIWIMDKNGEYQTQLTQNLGADYNPVWSPDGNAIIYISEVNGQSDLWIINLSVDDNVQSKVESTTTVDDTQISEVSEQNTTMEESFSNIQNDSEELEVDTSMSIIDNSASDVAVQSPISIFITIFCILLAYIMFNKE